MNYYDIAMIRPHLFLGSLTAAADSRLLKKFNVHAIVNLDGPELNYSLPPDIILLHRYFPDGTPIPHQFLTEILQFIQIHINQNHNILVHCAMGLSRSPSILIAWIMFRYPDLSWDQAFSEVSRKRTIWPALELKESIIAYFQIHRNKISI